MGSNAWFRSSSWCIRNNRSNYSWLVLKLKSISLTNHFKKFNSLFWLKLNLALWIVFTLLNSIEYCFSIIYFKPTKWVNYLFSGSFSMLSKHVEHNKCPFFAQKTFVDLSISFLQIKHLNIGDILEKLFKQWLYQFYNKKVSTHFLEFQRNINNNEKYLLRYSNFKS